MVACGAPLLYQWVMRHARPLLLPGLSQLPATDSVQLGDGFRYEGVWVDGRWAWALWRDRVVWIWDPQGKLGSYARN